MKRTITAFYETRAEAQKVSDALIQANLGAEVKIVDQSAAAAHPQHHDFVQWLGALFAGHADRHAYEEGLRRGHFLLTAKVDEMKETRAAEVLDAAHPLDLEVVQRAWLADGWPGPDGAPPASETGLLENPDVRVVGMTIRSYRLEPRP